MVRSWIGRKFIKCDNGMSYIRPSTYHGVHDRSYNISIGYIFHLSNIRFIYRTLLLLSLKWLANGSETDLELCMANLINIFSIYAVCFKYSTLLCLFLVISIPKILFACPRSFISNSTLKDRFI